MQRLVRLDKAPKAHGREHDIRVGMDAAIGLEVETSERVVHKISSRIAIVDDGNSVSGGLEEFDRSELTQTESIAVEAWSAMRVQQAPSPVRAWNAQGYSEPVYLKGGSSSTHTADKSSVAASAPVERYLVGSVAVGIVMVSRDTGREALVEPEQVKILEQILRGLDFLANVEPRAKVSFDYDLQLVTIDVPPGQIAPSGDAYERLEAPWRDAALVKLGFSAGRSGYSEYAEKIRLEKETKWGYVAFFTKYPVHHFAYAEYEKVVMHYDNDGWGPNNIGNVFAHETCHIFGAADEYGTCSCGSFHGKLRIKNGNCVGCGRPQVPCLMDRNELVLCDFSRKQLGWDSPLI